MSLDEIRQQDLSKQITALPGFSKQMSLVVLLLSGVIILGWSLGVSTLRTSFLGIVNLLIFGGFLRWMIEVLIKVDHQRQQAEQALQQMAIELEQRVAERTVLQQTVPSSLREDVSISPMPAQEHPPADVATLSYDRFDHALLNAPVPMMLHAEDGEVIAINHVWSELTGYTPADLPTIAIWTEKAYGEQADAMRAEIIQLYELNERWREGDYTIQTQTGETLIWEFSSAPLGSLPDGRRLVISTAMDVTERKLTELSLQADEERLRLVLDAARLGTWYYDIPTGEVLWSEQCRQMFGLTSADSMVSTFQDCLHPEERDRVNQAIADAITNQTPYDVEYRIVRRDGTVRWLLAKGCVVYEQQCEPVRIMGIALDVTDRKQAEDALQQLTATLELSVTERTDELTQANEHLQRELFARGLAEAVLQQETRRQTALIETQCEIATAGLNLPQVMTLIAERSQYLTQANGAVVELSDGDEMVCRAASGSAAPSLGLRLKISDSLSGHCFQTGTLLRCDDTELDARFVPIACARFRVRSMIVVPLQYGQKTLGVLKVLSAQVQAFDDKDMSALRLMAGTLAAAICYALEFELKQGLIAERTAALEQVQLLQTLMLLIAEAQDVQTALEQVLAIVGQFQGWNYGEVWLPDSHAAVLKCQATWHDSPDETRRAFAPLQSVTFASGIGLPGRVWASQQPEWRTDVSTESDVIFPRRSLALECGIKAGVGIPLVLDKQVLAILVFFKFEAASESKPHIESLSTIAAQLSLVIRRKQVEAALRQSEARNRALIEALPDLLIQMRSDGTYLDFSSGGTVKLFNPQQFFQGANVVNVLPEAHAQERLFYVQQALQTGTVQRYEYELLSHGEARFEEARLVACGEDEVLVIIRDVTDRKQAEQALQASEERLQLALEGSGDGLWDWHIATGYVYFSPQWLTMLGYTVGDLAADVSTWGTLVHPDDQPWVMETLNAHLEDASRPYAFDYRVRTKSGEWKWIGNYGKVVIRDEVDKPLRMAGMHKDISDRKRTEETLRNLTLKLQESNQELEQFAFIASHDLKEPLRTVRSFCSLLQRQHQDALDAKGHDYLNRIQGATQRMQNLIDDLLSLSRVATQVHPLVPIALTQVLEVVVTTLQTQIQQTGAKVEIGALPIVLADAGQLSQLFQNLISNALKFQQQAAPIVKIYSRSAGIGHTKHKALAKKDGFYQIFVEDNGIGFEEKYRDRIFGAFERLHGRGEYEGTGIGLAICKKIVERHGGSITAYSTPGQGATFMLTLPVIH